MNSILKKIILLIFALILFLVSCRKEEIELITTPEEEQLLKNSEVAILIQKISTNDGSIDNIIDNTNCLTIQLPVTVIVNGSELEINTIEDYLLIENIFDELDNDEDHLEIQFPITVILVNFIEIGLNSLDELNILSQTCNDENEIDFDIECIDFQYPISISSFNTNNGLIETITFNEDREVFAFIENIDTNDIITVNFPITLIIFDGSTIIVNNLLELEEEINTYKDLCDEDDDNDYNDDDCNDCNQSQIITFITTCPVWSVDKLKLSDNDFEDNYVNYLFQFNTDNTITVNNGVTFSGTWNAEGTGNNIVVTINIPKLLDFNNNWILREIEQETGEFKFDLRLGNDRLRFESDCTTINSITSISSPSVEEGDDLVHNVIASNATTIETYAFSIINNTTSDNDYNQIPVLNNGVTYDNTTGLISVPAGVSNFTVTITTIDDTEVEPTEFYNINIDTINAAGTITDNDTATLTLSEILIDGLWIVSTYLDNGYNETGYYTDYQINFDNSGTVIADNGTPINGTWSVQSADTELILDFGTNYPFNEFNDEWDVISITDTQIELQDVSGGGGGIDTLIFTKL
ncbi:MAG: hypothetical protein L3J23_00870 [Flavobacteriaceae bacterium]|nr:hypothetical protein [Flavobacteriaceae bacterium]